MTAIATAKHVVEYADYWHQPIRIIHNNESIFLSHDCRFILSRDEHDSSLILFSFSDIDNQLDFPDTPIRLMPVKGSVRVGVEVAWIGYPNLRKLINEKCFFFGRISAQDIKSFFIDGVAINGVSGGPVFYLHEDGHPLIIGTISAYMPNLSDDTHPYPGLSVAESISNLYTVADQLKSIEEARENKRKEDQPPPDPPNIVTP